MASIFVREQQYLRTLAEAGHPMWCMNCGPQPTQMLQGQLPRRYLRHDNCSRRTCDAIRTYSMLAQNP